MHSTSMQRIAVTMVELLVVLAVVAVLLGLFLPAIFYARESARRMHCSSNLKQIVLAIQNYESTHRFLPALGGPLNHSLLVSVLPHLEQLSLYNKYQFEFNVEADIANDQLSREKVPLFFCPSNDSDKGRTDYLVNQGTRVLPPFDGPFALLSRGDKMQTSSADVIRGTSNTVAMSETRPHGVGYSKQPTDYLAERLLLEESEHLTYISECRDRRIPRQQFEPFIVHGFLWVAGTQIAYHHIQHPNLWDCACGRAMPFGIYTANSNHRNGINLAYLDGHTGFIGNGVDRKAWLEIAKR